MGALGLSVQALAEPGVDAFVVGNPQQGYSGAAHSFVICPSPETWRQQTRLHIPVANSLLGQPGSWRGGAVPGGQQGSLARAGPCTRPLRAGLGVPPTDTRDMSGLPPHSHVRALPFGKAAHVA